MLSPNHLSEHTSKLKKLNIWVFHDARPGHLSQLEGLVKRLAFHANCEIHWFDITQHKLSVKHLFFLASFLKNRAKPDLILGAGHRTHLSVLIAGFKFKTFTSLIMKPSLPICLFDAIICPQHDAPGNSKKILNTFGPINKIDKPQSNSSSQTRTIHLILIGGLSKHYHLDVDHIIQQIQELCLESPDKQWLLSNSPRTPQAMNTALNTLNLPNLSIHDYKQGSMGSIQEILLKTKFTWITPDSMSMIFEALSADSQVGLIHCVPKNNKRIVRQVNSLADEGYVISFNDRSIKDRSIKTAQHHELAWEADRSALWLLDRIQSSHHVQKN